MLTNRIIGAFTFRKEVYAEVEKDTTFTTTAWLIVVVVAFLNQLGLYASSDLADWLISALVGTIFTVLAFAVAVLVINWVARGVFKADVTFSELVRTLGLAYVWAVIGVFAALAAVSTTLKCLLVPVQVIGAVMLVISLLVAAKEALDLDWVQTIVTLILPLIIIAVIVFLIAGLVLGALGFGAAALGGLFNF